MQAFERIITQIRKQLGKLSVNARLLIGSMMIILLMALLLVSQYAGDSKLSPLGLPNTAEVRQAAVRHLRAMNVEFEDRGDDLYVAAGRQYEIIGALSEREIVSTNQIDFNALIEHNANPFIGRDQARQNWLTAKMNVLSIIIGARSDVSMAKVIIDTPPRTPGIGAAHISTTATVAVKMNGTPLTQETADALGRMVAGAQAGLKVENVTVTDVASNRSFIPRGGDAMAAGGYLEHKQKTEAHFQRMIREQINIPGAIVSVNAVVKNTRISSEETTYDDPKIGPLASEARDLSSENTTPTGEPAVRPNAGATISPGGGRETRVNETLSRERTQPVFGGRNRVIEDPTGYPTEVHAVVALPRSYFVKVWQAIQGDPENEPDTTQLDSVFQQKKAELEQSLALLVKTGDLADAEAGEVAVRMYDDFDPVLSDTGVASTLVSKGGGAAVAGNDTLVKNIGLGALALVSLVMMFLMVRKANVREELPSAEELVGVPPSLEAVEAEVVGEADEGEPALVGMELEDGAVRTQQLLEQINGLVTNDAQGVATLFQRWMVSDD